MAAFDSLLRNNRDQVPPQNFYERLVHILMRKRDPIMPSNRRESMGGDATAAGIGGGDRCSTHEDDRLVRATIDIFRRIHAQHPVSSIELQRQGSRLTLHSNTPHLYFYFYVFKKIAPHNKTQHCNLRYIQVSHHPIHCSFFTPAGVSNNFTEFMNE